MYFIVGLIAVAIATWGFSFVLSQTQSNPKVLDVGGRSIDRKQLDRFVQFNKYQLFIRQQPIPMTLELVATAKQDLIQLYALLGATAEMGLTVPTGIIRSSLQYLPAFREQGQFSPERFQQFMTGAGLDLEDLYDTIREQLVTNWSLAAITSTQLIPDSLTQLYLNYQSQQRAFSYITVPITSSVVSVEQHDLKRLYDDNPSNYLGPKRYPIRFITLTQDDYTARVAPTTRQLKEFYVVQSESISLPLSFKFESVDFVWSPGATLSDSDLTELDRMFAADNSELDRLLPQVRAGYQVIFNPSEWYNENELSTDLLQHYWEYTDDDNNQFVEHSDFNVRLWKRTGVGRDGLPSFRSLLPLLTQQWQEAKTRDLFVAALTTINAITPTTSLDTLASMLDQSIHSDNYPNTDFNDQAVDEAIRHYIDSASDEVSGLHVTEYGPDQWLLLEVGDGVEPVVLPFEQVRSQLHIDWLTHNIDQWANSSQIDALLKHHPKQSIEGVYRTTRATTSVPQLLIDAVFASDVDQQWRVVNDDRQLFLYQVHTANTSQDESIVSQDSNRLDGMISGLEFKAFIDALIDSVYVYDVAEKQVINEGT